MIAKKGRIDEDLPSTRTISTILNRLAYRFCRVRVECAIPYIRDNFFAGRHFQRLDDLNEQATDGTMASVPIGDTLKIPSSLSERLLFILRTYNNVLLFQLFEYGSTKRQNSFMIHIMHFSS